MPGPGSRWATSRTPSGDLTTACEHWQIARALFHELKQGRDHAAVETRMLRNGCPTDWVLTDF